MPRMSKWSLCLAPVLVAAMLAAGCSSKEPPADKGKPALSKAEGTAPSPTSAAPSTTAPTGMAPKAATPTAAAPAGTATGKAAPTASAPPFDHAQGGVSKFEPPAAPVALPAVSAAEQQLLAEVVAMIPAETIALGTVCNPNITVGRLDAYAGPEIATLPGILLSFLPAEIIDMNAPMAWAVLPDKESAGAVLLARLKQGETLKGAEAPNAIVKLPGDVPLCAMKAGPWLVFGKEEALQLFKTKMTGPKFKVETAVQARLANDLAWIHLNAKPLAADLKPKIEQWKAEAQKNAGAGQSGNEAKLADWCRNLADQFDTLDVDVVMDGKRLVVRCDLGLADKGSLLALAQSMRPVETYEGLLPETDQFMAAGWCNIDVAKATPEAKEFLKPAVDLLLEKLGEMAAQAGGGAPPAKAGAPAPNPMEVLRASIEEQWKLADQYPEALTGQSAMLAEIPGRGEGMYRIIQVEGLKDNAKYQVLAQKSASLVDKMMKALYGAMPQPPGGPKMNVTIDYKTAAETIEGVPVDVMKFQFDFKAPPDMPPDAAMPMEMTQRMMQGFYGPDGLVTRMAVCGNKALSTTGHPSLMAKAIRQTRGGAGDLARQKPVAEALARVPARSSAVFLVSCPAYAYALDVNLAEPLLAALPPERQKTLKAVPRPRIEPPAPGDLAVLSIQVQERAVRFQMDVPQSEIARTVPYLRHLYADMLFDFFNIGFESARRRGMMTPGMEPGMDRVEPFDNEPAVPIKPNFRPDA